MPKGEWRGDFITCTQCGGRFKGNRGLAVHSVSCDGTDKSERGSRVRDRYREKFFAHNGPGPYSCMFCMEDVSFDDVHVHHVDHDRTNDDLDNLKPCHQPCHTKHHMGGWWSGKTHSAEHRAKVAAAKTGLTLSDETRSKISRAKTGQKRSEEAKAKTSIALRGRPKSEEHKRKIGDALRGKKRINTRGTNE